jgi:hypothetical protein
VDGRAPIELTVGDRRLGASTASWPWLTNVRSWHDVHAGGAAPRRAFPGVTEALQRAGLDRVGDCHRGT